MILDFIIVNYNASVVSRRRNNGDEWDYVIPAAASYVVGDCFAAKPSARTPTAKGIVRAF